MRLLLLFFAVFGFAHCSNPSIPPHDVLFDMPNSAINELAVKAYVPCTDEKFLYCQSQFNAFIGYSGSWSDPVALEQALRAFYKQDISSFLQLCHARTMLYQCFGTEYQTCTSRLQFIKKGANNTNAYQISGVFNSLDFECSGGIIQASQNWDCLYKIWNSDSYQNHKNTCITAFYNNINSENVCIAGQTLAKCFALSFLSADPPCNTAYDLNWFECERIVNMFQIDGNCQNIDCQVMNGGSSFESLLVGNMREAIAAGWISDINQLKAKVYRPSHGHEHDNFN
ncbi:hypothetical protein FO519_000616 [Halicephalobus sp. NKZ332]|nr:hypothetical protein FO519_000616 [Halicephalobus sp. NKZ332]